LLLQFENRPHPIEGGVGPFLFVLVNGTCLPPCPPTFYVTVFRSAHLFVAASSLLHLPVIPSRSEKMHSRFVAPFQPPEYECFVLSYLSLFFSSSRSEPFLWELMPPRFLANSSFWRYSLLLTVRTLFLWGLVDAFC